MPRNAMIIFCKIQFLGFLMPITYDLICGKTSRAAKVANLQRTSAMGLLIAGRVTYHQNQ